MTGVVQIFSYNGKINSRGKDSIEKKNTSEKKIFDE